MNLIITCARHLEPETEEEILEILEELGDDDAKVVITSMSGILTAETKLEPTFVTRKIREKILDEPWSIRYCLRIIPIQSFIETEIDEIIKEISTKVGSILKDETYRILIEKRNSNISSKEMISKIANNIKNKVSLDFPNKIILIEILGNKTGISIIKKSDLVSIEKTKRSLSD
ncbi:MAG: THUMP domain-containing protein [Nitrosopumilus sp.]